MGGWTRRIWAQSGQGGWDLEEMQWTPELNALLNQCVFASGYDFDASSDLFCQQATKLRLWPGDGELVVTANQCQEQWMALNPTEDGEGDDEEDRQEVPETSEYIEEEEEEEETAAPLDAGPRLELSLSEAELDQLLSTLPPSEEPEGSSADAKQSSEMQWVLAFLTDPDSIACADVEEKNLMGAPEKQDDDDNYQVFLQDLQDANLMPPAPVSAAERHTQQQQEAGKVPANGTKESDDSSDDEEEEEWERTRQAMKHSMKLR